MKVMMFAMAAKAPDMTKPPPPEALTAMHEYNDELEKAGKLVTLGGLMNTRIRVRFDGTKATVTDGPFTESKEMVAGYSVLEVSSIEEAIEIAKRSPLAITCPPGVDMWIEIRPLFDPALFDPPAAT
ncbi:MAG TPA: YciI family protein [Kofleriaceae bacterium]|jgi:hypothetical protein